MKKKTTPETIVALCRELPSATEDVKWGDNLVFSIGSKMFAVFDLPELEPISLKVDELDFEALIQHDGVRPAPYLARHAWITLDQAKALPVDTVKDLLEQSYRIVAAKLPKKRRAQLGIEPDE